MVTIRSKWAGVLAAAFVGVVIASAALGQERLVLYNGGPVGGQLLDDIGNWGSGSLGYVQGAQFLQLRTSGYFSGGRFNFADGVSLDPFLADPDHSYLELVLRATGAQGRAGAYGMGMMAPGMPMGPPGMGYPGMGTPWGSRQATALRKLRLVLYTDGGSLGAAEIPITGTPSPMSGWTQMDLPLSSLSICRGTPSGNLRSMLLFGNGDGTIYLISLALVHEDPNSAVQLPQPPDQTVDLGTWAVFRAVPAGPPPGNVQYFWDFDADNGIQVERAGPEVAWAYMRPGTYTATLMAVPTNPSAVPRTYSFRVSVRLPQAYRQRQQPGMYGGAGGYYGAPGYSPVTPGGPGGY